MGTLERPTTLESVDKRTKLAGENRLQLFLFNLGSKQRYGINVFKVREVLHLPEINEVPGGHEYIIGLVSIRGHTISVIDTAKAIKANPATVQEPELLIVTEYNGSVQGFAVAAVDEIIDTEWPQVSTPPIGAGDTHYLTGVVQHNDNLIEIIDVERVLADVVEQSKHVSKELVKSASTAAAEHCATKSIMIVDDSNVALRQMERCLEDLGFSSESFHNGREALEHLRSFREEGRHPSERYSLIISDIEMPEMDGYTLTAEIRNDDNLKDLKIILHSSVSGDFNKAIASTVGADRLVPKFDPNRLAGIVLDYLGAHDAVA